MARNSDSNKTITIDVADALLKEERQIAPRDHTTLRELVQEGLRRVIDERRPARKPFRLRSIKPEGPGYWPILRQLVTETKVAGPRIHDAMIAAGCLAHGVTELWTADRDFSRFPALRARNACVG